MQSSFLRALLLILCALFIGGTALWLGGRALLSSDWQKGISFSLQEAPPPPEDTTSSARIDSLKNLAPVDLGERLYRGQGCQSCHTLDGSRKIGPSFKGLYGTTGHEMKDGTTLTVDEEYLREAIVDPEAKIVAGYRNLQPAAYKELPDWKLAALVAFIEAQSEKSPPEE